MKHFLSIVCIKNIEKGKYLLWEMDLDTMSIIILIFTTYYGVNHHLMGDSPNKISYQGTLSKLLIKMIKSNIIYFNTRDMRFKFKNFIPILTPSTQTWGVLHRNHCLSQHQSFREHDNILRARKGHKTSPCMFKSHNLNRKVG